MSIRISKQYGVNPSVTHCECCGKEIGIALFGSSWKDASGKTAEAPMNVAMGLCDSCQSVIDQKGTIIIEVRDGESGKNPYRTGRIVGLSHDGVQRLFKDVAYSPMAYMEQSVFSKVFKDVTFNKEDK